MERADRCPLCGEDNECGAAAGRETCWCFEVVIPKEKLDLIPLRDRKKRCICPRCAGVANKAERSES